MLILKNDFLNFIEIINWVFVIKVSIFGCENRVVEKVFGGCLNLYNFRIYKYFIF